MAAYCSRRPRRTAWIEIINESTPLIPPKVAVREGRRGLKCAAHRLPLRDRAGRRPRRTAWIEIGELYPCKADIFVAVREGRRGLKLLLRLKMLLSQGRRPRRTAWIEILSDATDSFVAIWSPSAKDGVD